MEFGDRPHIYNEFLDIMKNFKSQQIDTPGVIRSVSNLFHGNKKLVLGFNTFLPEGYKIELPLDGNGPPVAVYQAPGQTGVTRILGPGSGDDVKREGGSSATSASAAASAPAPAPAPAAPPAATDAGNNAGAGGNQPVEFDHAINYVTTIKKRFASEPETYKSFLEILHTYQKEQRGIKEVLDEVSNLFADHPDLLKEFTYFLPDQVQEQAKKQLAEIVAKKGQMRRSHPTSSAYISLGYNPGAVQNNNPMAFGATKPRTFEREKEIAASAKYGTISFQPIKPKKLMNPAEAAMLTGRPRAIPVLAEQPTVVENAFFAKAKAHLTLKVLQHPQQSKDSNTPYSEFLKTLHLFAAQLISREELNHLVTNLFTQGQTGAVVESVKGEAAELCKMFTAVIDNRGPYAAQERANIEKAKAGLCNLKRSFEIAMAQDEAAKTDPSLHKSNIKVITPSYRTTPANYPRFTKLNFCDRTWEEDKLLNNDVVNIGTCCSYETQDYKSRGNVHETLFFDLEDQRYELDMAIDANTATLRQMEPVYKEIDFLKRQEENDGQPIGRMHYKLLRRTFTTSHLSAIGRIYGDASDIVLEHLKRNPVAVIPVVMARLKQKDTEWRQIRTQLNNKWRSLHERAYRGSLDFRTVARKRLIASAYDVPELLRPFAGGSKKPVKFKVDFNIIKLTYQLVSFCSESDTFNTDLDCSRIWCELFLPFFGFHSFTMLRETHAEYLPPVFPNNLTVMTAFGVGKVLYYSNDKQIYRVKLDYGMGWLSPNSIFYPIVGIDGGDDELKLYARHNHRLKSLVLPDFTYKRRKLEKTVDGNLKPTPIQTAYITKDMFIVMNLFHQIGKWLEKIRADFKKKGVAVVPDKKSTVKGKKTKAQEKAEKKALDAQKKAAAAAGASEGKSAGDLPKPSGEDDKDDPGMKRIAGHVKDPDKFQGFSGLLRERMRNTIDQPTYESACGMIVAEGMELGDLCYIPELIIRAADAMLAIIGADDEKEGSGNGFLRDVYLSTRNYAFDENQLLKSLTAYSKDNSRHTDFVDTMFEITYDSDKCEFATKFLGNVEKLMKGHTLREKPVDLTPTPSSDAMEVDPPVNTGATGRGGRSKRQRT